MVVNTYLREQNKTKGPLGITITKHTKKLEDQQAVIKSLASYKKAISLSLTNIECDNRHIEQTTYLHTCFFGVSSILDSYYAQLDNEEFDKKASCFLQLLQTHLHLDSSNFTNKIVVKIPKSNDYKSQYDRLSDLTNTFENYFEKATAYVKEKGEHPQSISSILLTNKNITRSTQPSNEDYFSNY